ncbi:MAG: HyaD/HybD family hydrogenase maturation endopeptidase [Anaerolineales bacterium]
MGSEKILVLGIGNLLNSDEGVGIHAIRALQSEIGSGSLAAEFVDGGTLGLNLLPLVESCSHLLLLDCVNAGKPGGTLVELAKDDIPLYTGLKMSQHQTTFQEVMGLASIRGFLPDHLHLVGVQPVSLDIGTALSPAVQAVLPDMIARAKAILQQWTAAVEPAADPNSEAYHHGRL